MRTISEATNIRSVVETVSANDADTGLNSKLTYSFLPNNYSSKEKFTIFFK